MRQLTARQLGAQASSEIAARASLQASRADAVQFGVCLLCAASGAILALLLLAWPVQ